MTLARTFLNRRGKISGRTYWTHCAVLLCVGVVLHLLAFGFVYAIKPEMISVGSDAFENIGLGRIGIIIPSILLISLLFYPYLCLYTKRLRGIGVSAYWYLAVFLVYCVGIVALGNIATEFLHITPTDLFMNEMNVSPEMSENEQVVAIRTHIRMMLISGAVFHTTLHAVVTIVIDAVLGKMKPRSGQKIALTNGLTLA